MIRLPSQTRLTGNWEEPVDSEVDRLAVKGSELNRIVRMAIAAADELEGK